MMKYLLVSLTVLAASASMSAASDKVGMRLASAAHDCDSFQSLQAMRATKGAQKACPERYLRLRMQEENNKADSFEYHEPKKEEPGFSLLLGAATAA